MQKTDKITYFECAIIGTSQIFTYHTSLKISLFDIVLVTLKNQEKKAERWREELIRFHNEKRLVERLRDKVRQEWLREQEKSFFKEMDELTILKTKVSE